MSRVTMPVPTREELRLGILYIIAAVFVFAVINALVKYEEETYPVTDVVFFRCLFALIFSLGLASRHGGISAFKTSRPLEHFGRSALQFISMISIYIAFHLMPLADAVAITFSNPLFLTVLSIPVLGEKVGRHRWGAVVVGFAGVIIMVQPGAGVFSVAALLALVNASVGASVTIALRRMSLTERSITLCIYQALGTTILSVLLLPFGWVTPSWQGAIGLAAIGLASGLGQFLWTQAFRLAPAAVLAPFNYTNMIWAIGFGYFMWGEMPTPMILLGTSVVVGSGLYILYRETVRRAVQPATLAAASGGTS